MKTILTMTTIITLGIASANAQSMDWLCHPGEYSQIEYLGGDLFKVKSPQGKYGIMHANGDMKINAKYDSITNIIENRALLLDKSGKRLWGIIDNTGEIVKDFGAEEYYATSYPNYKDGRLAFGTRNGLYGYLNDKGDIVITPQYYLAAPFQNGVAAVQYEDKKETIYGLINKTGRSVFISNTNYPFISSPVDGKVLVIRPSRKGGDQLVIMKIDGTKLSSVKTLEDGMNIWLSDDFSTIECQKGHTYKIDNQWRVVSSSNNASLPAITPEPSNVITESNTVLSKIATEGGVKITYLGNPIMDYTFPNVETYDKAYAVVRSKDGKVGVLRLNPSAAITISSPDMPTVFNHNGTKDVILNVDLVDVDPTKIKWYRNDKGWLTHSTLEQVDGQWKLRMPYFKSSESFDKEASESVDIAITYDGLDWLHQYVEVKSLHRPGYNIALTGSDVTNSNGNTTLTLIVTSLSGDSNTSGTVKVNGGKPIAFSGTEKKLPLSVSVPEGGSKKFTYVVEVSEEGCPTYSCNVSKVVSCPKKSEPVKQEKKKKELIVK